MGSYHDGETYSILSCICLLIKAFLLFTSRNHSCINFSSFALLLPANRKPQTKLKFMVLVTKPVCGVSDQAPRLLYFFQSQFS